MRAGVVHARARERPDDHHVCLARGDVFGELCALGPVGEREARPRLAQDLHAQPDPVRPRPRALDRGVDHPWPHLQVEHLAAPGVVAAPLQPGAVLEVLQDREEALRPPALADVDGLAAA